MKYFILKGSKPLYHLQTTEIEKKRDYFFLAQSFYPHLQQLKQQRNELEKQILDIKTQLSRKIFSGVTPQCLDFQELKEKLKKIQIDIKSIDHVMDEWNDLDESQLIAMRDDLFIEIWENFPDQFREQKNLWNELVIYQKIDQEINLHQQFLTDLTYILRNIRDTRVKMKGKGLLSYIFGTSPNAIIEKHLLFAHDLILTKQNLFENNPIQSHSYSYDDLIIKVQKVTNELKSECKKIWNFTHIDITIANCEKNILNTLDEINQFKQATETRLSEFNDALDEWLKNIKV